MHRPALALSPLPPALSRRHRLHGDRNAEARSGMSPAASHPSVASHEVLQSEDPAVNVPSRNPGVARSLSPMPSLEALTKTVIHISLLQEKRMGGWIRAVPKEAALTAILVARMGAVASLA